MKNYKELQKRYDKAIKLLDIALDWANEVISDEDDSPTIKYVNKQFEKLTA
jgi:hypothetical protein